MRVDLSFCDVSGTRIHEKDIICDGTVPIPGAGEIVLLEGKDYKVNRRHFVYLSGGVGLPDVQVTFYCDKIEPKKAGIIAMPATFEMKTP
jgi:hypothetical protein